MLKIARLLTLAFLLWLPALATAQVTVEYQGKVHSVATYDEAVALANRLGAGNERILRYDIAIQINADSTLTVEETIRVHAEGQSIRRGIYRDYPTRYTDRYGNNVTVGFHVQDVLRNGKPEPWFSEHISNGTRVNTGNDDFLPVPADYTYTLRYTTTRQLGFFKNHDELYWNAIGTGWMFPIEQATVSVRLPQPVPTQQLHAEGYTGAQGAAAQHYTAQIPAPGQATWALTQPLNPYEGLTIALTFPKGIITPPTAKQYALWYVQDNPGPLILVATVLLVLSFLFLRWRQLGMDPEPGVIIVRYAPPEGYSPAALRFIEKMLCDTLCFTADLVALAVAGHIKISSEKNALSKEQWTLERTDKPDDDTLPASQQALLKVLAHGQPPLLVKAENRAKFMNAILNQAKVLEQTYNKTMFHRNAGTLGIAFLVSLAGIIAGTWIANGSANIVLVATIIILLISLIVFGFLLPAHTPQGRKLLDAIEGFRRYLSVAERDELTTLQISTEAEPALDAQRYAALLPYAIALGVANAWTEKFTAAVGSAEAAQTTTQLSWYHGSGMTSLSNLSSSLSGSLSSSIASASTPPGSSSGSGGGGSSGGGGGGGGGGGR